MNATSWKERHANAMLSPEGDYEIALVVLFTSLTRAADKYAHQAPMISVVEDIGSAIIRLLNDDTGRLDQGLLEKQVRDVVERAGGNIDEL